MGEVRDDVEMMSWCTYAFECPFPSSSFPPSPPLPTNTQHTHTHTQNLLDKHQKNAQEETNDPRRSVSLCE
jgi:hypothetical protein